MARLGAPRRATDQALARRAPKRDSGAAPRKSLCSRPTVRGAADRAATNAAVPTRDLPRRGIGLLASPTEVAQAAEAMLRKRYIWADADEAETLVALGGDGFMLHTLHAMLEAARLAPGVRDEPRHGRLPDERMAPRPAGRAHRGGQGDPRRPARDARDDGRAAKPSPMPRSTKSRCCAKPARPPRSRSGQRPRGDARAGLRRRAGRDPGRVDRLQSLGAAARSCRWRRRCWR